MNSLNLTTFPSSFACITSNHVSYLARTFPGSLVVSLPGALQGVVQCSLPGSLPGVFLGTVVMEPDYRKGEWAGPRLILYRVIGAPFPTS